MKKTFRHILSGCALLTLGACSPSDEGNEGGGDDGALNFVTVVSFNIRVDNAADGDNVWANRKSASVAMIKQERPTVMGLQEAQPHQITYLAKNCPGYAWYGLGRDTGNVPAQTESYAAEECMAIFYLTTEVELLDKGTFWLSQTPGIPSKGWDAAYNRSCTWGLFRHKASGRQFYFLNTHLDNRGSAAREESLKLIASKIGQLNGRSLPALLTADFNSDTTDKIFAPLFRILRDARKMASDSDSKATYNGFKDTSTSRLDHIFYSGCTASLFRTLTGNYGAPYISDHYPVKARFVLP